MLDAFLNAFRVKDVRNKIFLTFALIGVYRIGTQIVLPGIDPVALQGQESSGMMQLADVFTGGAFSQYAIFALGIMPYISAAIIMQLLQGSVPYLEELKKEGQEGQNKINQYTRYLTVGLAFVESIGLIFMATSQGVGPNHPGFWITGVVTLTSGAVFVMWLGEQISEYGIGNGMSLLIYANIIAFIPDSLAQIYTVVSMGSLNIISFVTMVILLLGLFVLAVWLQTGERRVPVKYARQVQGRKVHGGRDSHLPLKVDYSGIIAVIFASAVMMVPAFFFQASGITGTAGGWFAEISSWFSQGAPLWALCYGALIVFFCYFYTAITFNPDDIAENLQKSGGFIPGRRPGDNTSEYIDRILNRITLVGALTVVVIAILPIWMTSWFGVSLSFGGTSILILVGVGLDFVQKLESQLVMRHYDGFMESGKVEGRGFGA